jgi:hypothetical protein
MIRSFTMGVPTLMTSRPPGTNAVGSQAHRIDPDALEASARCGEADGQRRFRESVDWHQGGRGQAVRGEAGREAA